MAIHNLNFLLNVVLSTVAPPFQSWPTQMHDVLRHKRTDFLQGIEAPPNAIALILEARKMFRCCSWLGDMYCFGAFYHFGIVWWLWKISIK